jgi:hypothetical protein
VESTLPISRSCCSSGIQTEPWASVRECPPSDESADEVNEQDDRTDENQGRREADHQPRSAFELKTGRWRRLLSPRPVEAPSRTCR